MLPKIYLLSCGHFDRALHEDLLKTSNNCKEKFPPNGT
jgi:hypothetical protein